MSKIDKDVIDDVGGIDQFLDKDGAAIANRIGAEMYLEMMEHFGGMILYISLKPITRAKAAYFVKHYNGNNFKELLRKLGVSESFARRALNANAKKLSEQRKEKKKATG